MRSSLRVGHFNPSEREWVAEPTDGTAAHLRHELTRFAHPGLAQIARYRAGQGQRLRSAGHRSLPGCHRRDQRDRRARREVGSATDEVVVVVVTAAGSCQSCSIGSPCRPQGGTSGGSARGRTSLRMHGRGGPAAAASRIPSPAAREGHPARGRSRELGVLPRRASGGGSRPSALRRAGAAPLCFTHRCPMACLLSERTAGSASSSSSGRRARTSSACSAGSWSRRSRWCGAEGCSTRSLQMRWRVCRPRRSRRRCRWATFLETEPARSRKTN